MDTYGKVKDSRSALEKLLDIIPGWGGYQERQTRRKADQVLRQTLAEKLADQRRKMDVAQQDLISHGRVDLVDDVGVAVTQLQTFIDRVRTAAYGYGGLLSADRVKEDDLDAVYEFDTALVDYADRIEGAIDRARAGLETEDLKSLILMIRDLAREANTVFDERKAVLSGNASTGI